MVNLIAHISVVVLLTWDFRLMVGVLASALV